MNLAFGVGMNLPLGQEWICHLILELICHLRWNEFGIWDGINLPLVWNEFAIGGWNEFAIWGGINLPFRAGMNLPFGAEMNLPFFISPHSSPLSLPALSTFPLAWLNLVSSPWPWFLKFPLNEKRNIPIIWKFIIHPSVIFAFWVNSVSGFFARLHSRAGWTSCTQL